jgi:hypothetical protein
MRPLMQEAAVTEGIVDILPHPGAIGLEPPELQSLSIPDLSQHVQFVTPEKIVEMQSRLILHRHHLAYIVKQLYYILTLSTLI